MAHLEDALRPASVLQSDLSLSRVPLRSPSQERPGFSLSPARLLIPLGHGPLEYPYKDRWFSPSSPGGPFLTRGPDRRWRGRCPRSGSLHDRLVLPIPPAVLSCLCAGALVFVHGPVLMWAPCALQRHVYIRR